MVEIINSATAIAKFEVLGLVWLSIFGIMIPHYCFIQKKTTHAVSNCMYNDKISFRNDAFDVCRKWFYFLFPIGAIGIILMIARIGINGFIIYAGSSRGEGTLEIAAGSIFAYSIKLAKLLPAALVPGITMWELKKSYKLKIVLIIIFALSLLLEIYISGKTNFLLFGLPIAVYIFTRRKQFKLKHLITLFVLVVVGIPLLDNLFYYLTYGVSINIYRSSWSLSKHILNFAKQFMYPYSNLLLRTEINNYYGLRWGADYLVTFVNSIPAFLLGGFQMDTAYNMTTSFYHTAANYTNGGVPNDYIFLCYRQFGVVGVFIVSILRGVIIKLIDKSVTVVKTKLLNEGINPYYLLTSCCVSSVLFTLMEPYSAVNSMPMVICAVLLSIHLKKRFSKRIYKRNIKGKRGMERNEYGTVFT